MSGKTKLPLAAVLVTMNRPASVSRTLESLSLQDASPRQIIVIDASEGDDTECLVRSKGEEFDGAVSYHRISPVGAGPQRNRGVSCASEPFVFFFDDDVEFEPECLARLWIAINSDPKLGGVSAMVTNQRYSTPGRISRAMFALMNGSNLPTFAGKVMGPAVNLLPEDRAVLPEVVPVEWLNTTCTLYRRDALPQPPFDPHFTGYSMMEDLTLSLRVVQRGWKLANARTARIFHDSQPGGQKSNAAIRAEMELVNRHYVMTEVLGRRDLINYARLALWELFQLITMLATAEERARLPAILRGKCRALRQLLTGCTNASIKR